MTTALEHPRPVATPARVGQATTVEQSRAIAEVQAQVIVAQQFRRSVPGAIDAMEEACQQPELASRAFFRFPRGGETVSGASVYLARELARCWGNVQHGITELARDDAHGQSEMMAWAWDVETNTRSSNTFIVPHVRDTRNGARQLTDMRDIYENNANQGARRLREAIFSVLPSWYTARAQSICQQTIEHGGGKPVAQRIAEAVKAFERFRVSPGRMAAKFGYDSIDKLTATDVAQLGVVYDSLRQGTVTVDDEFPAEPSAGVSAADILGEGAQLEKPAERRQRRAAAANKGQVGMIRQCFERLGYTDDDRPARLHATSQLAGRKETVTSTNDLSADEAARVLVAIRDLSDATDLAALLDSITAGENPDGEVPSDGQ